MSEEHLEHHAPYGGQAVIEGVMMRSPRFFAVAVRRANGETLIKQESVQSYLKKFMWLNKPFLRGTLALIDAMAMGIKALTYSANIAAEDIDEEDHRKSIEKKSINEPAVTKTPILPASNKEQHGAINDIVVWSTLALGLALGVFIFFVIPQLLTGLLDKYIQNGIVLNLIEGSVRIVFFIAYVAAISLMGGIRRVFEYHGAEHKVINTFEAGHDLTEENLNQHGQIHPRCGTSFIVVVLIVSIIVFSFLGWEDIWYERIISRLILLPVVAGIAYELIKFAGRNRSSLLLKMLIAPGLLVQRLTTRKPDDEQVEVALRALQAVIEKEKEIPA